MKGSVGRAGLWIVFLLFTYLVVAVPGEAEECHGDRRSCPACHVREVDPGCSPANDFALAQSKIRQYLSSGRNNNGVSKEREGEFYIQGWRWHTMALAREAYRLHRLSESYLSNETKELDVDSLKQAADYVVGFNMKGLHKVERDLFFPWVRNKVESLKEKEILSAFSVVMDRLDSAQKTIENLGQSLNQAASRMSNAATEREACAELSMKAAAIADGARSMLKLEDELLVPTIAKVVPASEQKAFNDKVIRKLGILDSRLHLVGMYEAVWELDNEQERQLFKNSIPSIPQMMIPRWRRLLYEPRVGILNQV